MIKKLALFLFCDLSSKLNDLLYISYRYNIAIISFDNVDYKNNIILNINDYEHVSLNNIYEILSLNEKQVFIIKNLPSFKKAFNHIVKQYQPLCNKFDYLNKRTDYYLRLLRVWSDSKSCPFSAFSRKHSLRIIKMPSSVENIENIYKVFKRAQDKQERTKKRIDIIHLLSDDSFCYYVECDLGSFGLIAFSYIQNKKNIIVINEKYSYLSQQIENSSLSEDKEFCYPSFDSVLFKGPCDVRSVFSLLTPGNYKCEFTFTTDNNISIETGSHFLNIIQAFSLDNCKINKLLELPFNDKKVYSKTIFSKQLSTIILSVLTDANLGVYKNKNNNSFLVFGEKNKPINMYKAKYKNHIFSPQNYHFDKKTLLDFVSNYRYVGWTTPRKMVNYLHKILPLFDSNQKIILFGGVEKKYFKCKNTNYFFRNVVHAKYRKIITKEFASDSRIIFFSIDPYVINQSSFNNHYNHFKEEVYLNFALDLVNLMSDNLIDLSLSLFFNDKLY